MANQISIAEMVQGPPEGRDFTRRTSLDGKLVVEVISKGAAGAWQMSNRGETMVDDEFDFGFAVDGMCKDLGIAITEAKRNGAQLSLTVLVDQFYREVQAMGGGRWDTSSLLRRLQRRRD